MTIDWANVKIQINAPHIQHLLKTIREQKVAFETISFKHIYRELNPKVEVGEGNQQQSNCKSICMFVMEHWTQNIAARRNE